jgi:hypothetical protein
LWLIIVAKQARAIKVKLDLFGEQKAQHRHFVSSAFADMLLRVLLLSVNRRDVRAEFFDQIKSNECRYQQGQQQADDCS